MQNPGQEGCRFFAEKNISTDCIDHSKLQLGAGTVLVIDETRMTEGCLNQHALHSIKALESVVKQQMLPVNFEYCPGIRIPTDVCVILVSKSPSILAQDMIKCFSPTEVFAQRGEAAVSKENENEVAMDISLGFDAAEELHSIRQWWAHCRVSNASLDDGMVSYVEEDFVTARQKRNQNNEPLDICDPQHYPIEGADFHNWLTLSRLQTIAEGNSVISPAQWKKIRRLESDRYHNKLRLEAQLSSTIQ